MERREEPVRGLRRAQPISERTRGRCGAEMGELSSCEALPCLRRCRCRRRRQCGQQPLPRSRLRGRFEGGWTRCRSILSSRVRTVINEPLHGTSTDSPCLKGVHCGAELVTVCAGRRASCVAQQRSTTLSQSAEAGCPPQAAPDGIQSRSTDAVYRSQQSGARSNAFALSSIVLALFLTRP